MKNSTIPPRRFPYLLALFCALNAVSCTSEEVAVEVEEGSPIQRTEVLRAPGFDRLDSFGESETGQIDLWLEQLRKSADYPGLAAVIVGEGRVLYQGAVGYADIGTGRKFTPDTLWHVASVTKAFTCTLAAILHDRSVIDLDSPAIKYLPEGVTIGTDPEMGATITLRQLASHTSGLPRGIPGYVQSIDGRYDLEPKRLYQLLDGVDLIYDPGTDDEYSNLGLGLLGHVLEAATGKSLNQLLKEEVLVPLGMNHSGVFVDDEHRALLAAGYGEALPRRVEESSYRRRLAGSGGLVASVAELSRFLIAQMPESGGFLSSSMRENLHVAAQFTDGSDTRRALGWSIREADSIGRYLSKNGGRNNTSAWIGFSPEAGVGVAVLTNCGGPNVDPIGFWLLERAVPGADVAELNRDAEVEETFAKVAPFTGVRWGSEEKGHPEFDQLTVEVRGEWYRLVAVEGIAIDKLMQISRLHFGDKARKRFTEDLVELLAAAGHDPGWSVTLMLDREDGNGPQAFEEKMTFQKRNQAAAGNTNQAVYLVE